jgi:hypothetical protein
MKRYIKLFENFKNNDKLEWAYNQAKSYAETFDEEEDYDAIVNPLERFKEDPESMDDHEYANILYQSANNNYYKLGEVEIIYDPMSYSDFLEALDGLIDDIKNGLIE